MDTAGMGVPKPGPTRRHHGWNRQAKESLLHGAGAQPALRGAFRRSAGIGYVKESSRWTVGSFSCTVETNTPLQSTLLQQKLIWTGKKMFAMTALVNRSKMFLCHSPNADNYCPPWVFHLLSHRMIWNCHLGWKRLNRLYLQAAIKWAHMWCRQSPAEKKVFKEPITGDIK